MKRLLGCGGLLFVLCVAACVGDDPGPSAPAQSSSGGSSSSSSGGASSGASGSSSGAATDGGGSSSSSGGDAGDAAATCKPPLPAPIDMVDVNRCGSQDLPQTAPVVPEDLGMVAMFHGGTITPGQYVLVSIRTNGDSTINSAKAVYVFDGTAYSLHAFDNVDVTGDTEVTARGTYSTRENELTLQRTCSVTEQKTFFYSVDVIGCDLFLHLGQDNIDWTYQLRREP